MCGLAINIASFTRLLKRVDFDTIVTHLAIAHIMKSKMEPATNRIKRLLEILSSYSFNLYYIKGKNMILSDFLSRQIEDDSNPHEIIPIPFNIWDVLQDNYHQLTTDTYNMQTRAQAKAQANIPTMPNTPPKREEQKATPEATKLPIKAERRERELKVPSSGIALQTPMNIGLPPNVMLLPIVMPPNDRPPPKPPNIGETDLHPGPDTKMDIEENSPHQEGIITEAYIAPDQS